MAGYVYRRESKWYIAYRNASGRLRRESSNSPTKELAKQLLARRIVEVAEGKVSGTPKPEGITLRQMAAIYLRWSRKNRRASTARRNKSLLEQLLKFFGDPKLRDIRTREVEAYKSRRADHAKPATVNREIASLRHLFNLAIKWDYVTENPVARKVEFLEENNTITRCLADEEEGRLMASLPQHLKAIAKFALHTGMRRGEILNLTWPDISLENGLIRVRPESSKGKRHREIPIDEVAREVLSELPRSIDCPYVFWNPDTGDVRKELKTAWLSAVKRAGIKDFRFHDLRHTFASRLVQREASLVAVKDLLGHSDIKTTMRYSHLAPSDLRRAISLLDSPKITTQIATHPQKPRSAKSS